MAARNESKLSLKSKSKGSNSSQSQQQIQDGGPNNENTATDINTPTKLHQGKLAEQLKQLITSDTDLLNNIAESLACTILNTPSLLDSITQRLTTTLKDDVTQHVYDAVSFDINEQKNNTSTLKNQQSLLANRISDLESKIDDLEQYSRRNCLLIHGVPEQTAEQSNQVALNIIRDRLDIQITESDLDRSHRLGKRKNTDDNTTRRPRPIIVKFCTYGKRQHVFQTKRKLKSTGITITESLTAKRAELLRRTKTHDAVKNAWTLDGIIHGITTNDRKITIKSSRDLHSL